MEGLKLTDGAVLHEDYLRRSVWWLEDSIYIFSGENPGVSWETDVLRLASWEHGEWGCGVMAE